MGKSSLFILHKLQLDLTVCGYILKNSNMSQMEVNFILKNINSTQFTETLTLLELGRVKNLLVHAILLIVCGF